MLLASIVLAVSLHPILQQSITCGRNVDVERSRVSLGGDRIILHLHSGDDHGKNTHLCQSEYTISGTRSDGTPIQPQTISIVDGAWSRNIIFGLNGFTFDGNHIIATISDGGGLDIIVYDLRTGEIKSSYISDSFLEYLGSCRKPELEVAGTTDGDSVVLATVYARKCPQEQTWWIVRPRVAVKGIEKPSTPTPMPDGATLEILEPFLMTN